MAKRAQTSRTARPASKRDPSSVTGLVRSVRRSKAIFQTPSDVENVRAEIDKVTSGDHLVAALASLAMPGSRMIFYVEQGDRAYAVRQAQAAMRATDVARSLRALADLLETGAVRMLRSLMVRSDWYTIVVDEAACIEHLPGAAIKAAAERLPSGLGGM